VATKAEKGFQTVTQLRTAALPKVSSFPASHVIVSLSARVRFKDKKSMSESLQHQILDSNIQKQILSTQKFTSRIKIKFTM
jgi:hypothetical protein